MVLKEIIQLINGELLTDGPVDTEIKFGCGSDLMSDVLAYVEDDTLLLTGLTNNQVIRTAEMLDLRAIVFVRGKLPNSEVIEMATDKEIVLISTNHSLFTTAGILYQNGLVGKTF